MAFQQGNVCDSIISDMTNRIQFAQSQMGGGLTETAALDVQIGPICLNMGLQPHLDVRDATRSGVQKARLHQALASQPATTERWVPRPMANGEIKTATI